MTAIYEFPELNATVEVGAPPKGTPHVFRATLRQEGPHDGATLDGYDYEAAVASLRVVAAAPSAQA